MAGAYAPIFDTLSGEPTIQRLVDLSLGYASSATIAESDIIKDNVTSTQNGKVIVVKKGILDVLGADFYMYVRNEGGNNIGSVWYEELLLAFDRVEILSSGGSPAENGDSTPRKR